MDIADAGGEEGGGEEQQQIGVRIDAASGRLVHLIQASFVVVRITTALRKTPGMTNGENETASR